MSAPLRRRLAKIRERAKSQPPKATIWLPHNGRGPMPTDQRGSVRIYPFPRPSNSETKGHE